MSMYEVKFDHFNINCFSWYILVTSPLNHTSCQVFCLNVSRRLHSASDFASICLLKAEKHRILMTLQLNGQKPGRRMPSDWSGLKVKRRHNKTRSTPVWHFLTFFQTNFLSSDNVKVPSFSPAAKTTFKHFCSKLVLNGHREAGTSGIFKPLIYLQSLFTNLTTLLQTFSAVPHKMLIKSIKF